MSKRSNAEILFNQSSLIVMGIISYRIKQHLTIYIGEVLARSGRGSLTGYHVNTADHNCPADKIGVASNFKNLRENISDRVCLQKRSRL